ncbi:MAG: hypothetical protein GX866_04260, partial [Firmicutes bacterium]|nr:hypothetical protein [Bacillota bacterium]
WINFFLAHSLKWITFFLALVDQFFSGGWINFFLTIADLESAAKTRRSPDFRNRILRAYEYQCAVCGFNVRLGDTLVAVEAAHIKWHQYGGPDCEENGIALCSMHHKLFDKGVFTLDQSLVFRVAEEAHGTFGFEEWLMRYHGRPIRQPQKPDYYPNENYINWHVREVFRGPSRYTADNMENGY